MTLPENFPSEAPTMQIVSEAEFRQVLERIRALEAAPNGTAEALERASLERAVANFTAAPRGTSDDKSSATKC